MNNSICCIQRLVSKYKVPLLDVERVANGFTVFEDRIILISKLTNLNPELINVRYDLLEMLVKPADNYLLLFDIDAGRRPDAESRRIIVARLNRIKCKIKHAAFGSGKDTISENAVEFLMAAAGINEYSIHHNLREAMNMLNHYKIPIKYCNHDRWNKSKK